MKPWQWILLAGGALVVIVVIMKTTAKPANGAVNPNLSMAAGVGGLLAGLFGGGKKASAPSGTAGSIPGDTGYNYNGLSGQDYGRAYAGANPGYTASENAGGGGGGAAAGAAAGAAGYRASEDAGSGFLGQGGYTPSLTPQLTAPTFDIGTGGADFSN